jgi:hypothetical protein
MDSIEDPLKVLGLPPGADPERIDRADRPQVRRYPPELNPARFARVRRAYELLCSLERAMEEARRMPEETLAALFPAPRPALRPEGPAPAPLRPQDLELLLRKERREALERLLRQAFAP